MLYFKYALIFFLLCGCGSNIIERAEKELISEDNLLLGISSLEVKNISREKSYEKEIVTIEVNINLADYIEKKIEQINFHNLPKLDKKKIFDFYKTNIKENSTDINSSLKFNFTYNEKKEKFLYIDNSGNELDLEILKPRVIMVTSGIKKDIYNKFLSNLLKHSQQIALQKILNYKFEKTYISEVNLESIQYNLPNIIKKLT